MAGHRISTDLEPEAALKLSRRVARELEFEVHRDGENWGCRAEKGNLVLSVFTSLSSVIRVSFSMPYFRQIDSIKSW